MEPKKTHSNSFYEQEIRAVLGIPPPRLILLGNTILFLIVAAILAYIFLIKHPVTYQAQLLVPEEYQADTIKISWENHFSAIKKIHFQDRQLVEKGASLFDFLDTAGQIQTVYAPHRGKIILLQKEWHPASQSKDLCLLLKQAPIQQFHLPIPASDIDFVTVGQAVTIFSSEAQISSPGIIQSIHTDQEQLYALIEPTPANSLQTITDHYQLSFTLGHETLFDKFFNQKK